jgi:NTE family protein
VGGRRLAGALLAASLLGACIGLGGCAGGSTPTNLPLAGDEPNQGYSIIELNGSSGREDVLVMAAFSGGGKRSAAFAHGALRGLRALPVPRPDGGASTMLAELDQISAVSGGTFPAAHYALHGEASFATFPDAFLHRDIEAYIWGTYALPWNWGWVASASRGTNDRMAAIYDQFLFGGATYADLIRRGRPRLSVNATELATGITFAFLPQPFDLICSDLARFPLARAVAASNGFPLLFSPITLENHRRERCAVPMPPFPPPEAVRTNERQRQLDQVMRRFSDPERAAFLHLMDGGISDNLGMRHILNIIGSGGERGPDYERRIRPIRRILILSVDGQAATNPALSRQRNVTGLATVINAVSGGQIDNYNLETVALARIELDRQAERSRAVRCREAPRIDARPCGDVAGMLVRIALSDHPDPALRARLQAIPTGLTIAREDVELLVAAGEEMARTSPDLRAFIAGIDAPVAPPARVTLAAIAAPAATSPPRR